MDGRILSGPWSRSLRSGGFPTFFLVVSLLISTIGLYSIVPEGVVGEGGRAKIETLTEVEEVYDLMVMGGDAYDNLGRSVIIADLDNDGFGDLVIGANHADGVNDARGNSGEVSIFWGPDITPRSVVDFALSGPDVRIVGGRGDDRAGRSLDTGDINGDDIIDLVIGANEANGRGNSPDDCGNVNVLYGKERSLWADQIDLMSQSDVLIIGWNGADFAGESVACGDFNGDGFDDILIGAQLGNGPANGRNNAGEAYVVFGGTSLNATIDLNPGAPGFTSDVIIYGSQNDDRTGYDVCAGDLNGDGKDEIIIGAYRANPMTRGNAGTVSVIFGSASLAPQYDLNTGTSDPHADLTIMGGRNEDRLGFSVACGDLNGDGYDDLAMAAYLADGPQNSRTNAGEVHVLYGKSSGFGTSIDLQVGTDLWILGINSYDYAGYFIGFGNINGDAYEDLLIGSEGANGIGNNADGTGELAIVLGNSTQSLSSPIELTSDAKYKIYGIDVWDRLGTAAAAGDVDGDGLDDLLIGAFTADAEHNARYDAGEVYFLYSTPPRIRHEELTLMNGGGNGTLCLAEKEYTFVARLIDYIGYDDLSMVTLTLDPGGADMAISYDPSTDYFYKDFNDFGNYIDLVEGQSSAWRPDKFTTVVNFTLRFHWTFPNYNLTGCMVSSTGVGALPEESLHPALFRVESRCTFLGELNITATRGGPVVIRQGDWVKGGETLDLKGLRVVYKSTNTSPPADSYRVLIRDQEGVIAELSPIADENITLQFNAAEASKTDAQISVDVISPMTALIPDSKKPALDVHFFGIDADPPTPPDDIFIRRATDPPGTSVSLLNVGGIVVEWSSSFDTSTGYAGSGVHGYYIDSANNSYTELGHFQLHDELLPAGEHYQGEISELMEGDQEVFVWAVDKVGNIGIAESKMVYVDFTPLTFSSPVPTDTFYSNSTTIDCSVSISDGDGAGVDPFSVMYRIGEGSNFGTWSQATFDVNTRKASATASLTEGTNNWVQWEAIDMAGNGPTRSGSYQMMVDTTPVSFYNGTPETGTSISFGSIQVGISIGDAQGSGVHKSSLEISSKLAGTPDWSEWEGVSRIELTKGTSGKPLEIMAFATIDLPWSGNHSIKWRAKDLAGNVGVSGPTEINLNRIPTLVIDSPLDLATYISSNEISFDASNSSDPDLNVLHYHWVSSLSGPLSDGSKFSMSLKSGLHKITVWVDDDHGHNISRNITIFVSSTQQVRDDDGGSDTDSSDDEGVKGTEDSSFDPTYLLMILIMALFAVLIVMQQRSKKRTEELLKEHLDRPTSEDKPRVMPPPPTATLKSKEARPELLPTPAPTVASSEKAETLLPRPTPAEPGKETLMLPSPKTEEVSGIVRPQGSKEVEAPVPSPVRAVVATKEVKGRQVTKKVQKKVVKKPIGTIPKGGVTQEIALNGTKPNEQEGKKGLTPQEQKDIAGEQTISDDDELEIPDL